ncbi:MAG: phosphoglycerate dehydrogenase, partial [Leptospiraceae bacterium]|nr:phosphoglycerate dehydrogenase [Leptospiraceae bacterium]
TPQANQSMHAGKWEKSKFKGVELTGKTLGVVGLGRIGKEVVKRARGLRMRVLGFDPFIPAENLAHLEIEIKDKDTILSEADFITVHTPLTDTTRDLVNLDNLSRLKDGVRLINCARGGIYNEEALAQGLESGKLGGVALDVFTNEPVPADFPLLKYENCIMTPHLGASTDDAEFAVAMESVDELIEYFESGVARNALNFPTVDPDSMDFLEPYFSGGQRVGKLLAHICGGDVTNIRIDYCGEISQFMVQPVTTSILCGALTLSLGDQVNVVNAPVFARDRKIEVSENKVDEARGFSSFVHVRMTGTRGQTAELRYTSINKEPLVFSLSNLPLEFRPNGILLVLRNKDVPRVIGNVGNFLADHEINIANMELGRDQKGGTAHSVLTIDELLDRETLEKLSNQDHIMDAVQVDLR